jgi:ferredoxin-thioredoxin reductase catalytic chain
MTTQYLSSIPEMITQYAARNGWVLNPNRKHRDKVIAGLEKNRDRHGFPYCPCRVVAGVPAVDALNICPCASHRTDIEQTGHCACNLFYREG